jgi:microcystin-dependent protein
MIKRQSFLASGAGALLAGCASPLSRTGPLPASPALRRSAQGFALGYVGQLLLVPYDYVPAGWALCDGSQLPIKDFVGLFSLLGTRFGGNGSSTFGLPDLRGHEPLKGLRYVIALYGELPWDDSRNLRYYGELLLAPYEITPKGWTACDGSLLPIAKNEILYALIGTTFGGDGLKTFALPDTRGHEPIAGLKYFISLDGMFPSRSAPHSDDRPQTDVYVGELLLVPYYTPQGWLPCDGQTLPISAGRSHGDHILYVLFGTKFGGNGKTTFALPDMRDRGPAEFLNYVIALPGVFPPR